MSHLFEGPVDPDENDETSEETSEADENTEVLADAEEFAARYGFVHDCHCAEDWDTGNLGVVSVCYLNMCRDALEHLATARAEIIEKDAEIAALRVELADA